MPALTTPTFAAVLLVASPQAPPTEPAPATELTVACRAAARTHFDGGLRLLHAFAYEDAEAAFGRAVSADRRCAMAHWGLAMSQYPPLGDAPTQAMVEKGARAAAQAAGALAAASVIERDLVAAVGVLYRDHPTVDHATRARAFRQAMEEVHRKHPQEVETAAFYALALLATPAADADRQAAVGRAGEVLEGALARQPGHPGAAHYLVRAFDSRELARRALEAAQALAASGPPTAETLHLPSHVFLRLGRWEDTVQANLAAADAARAQAERLGPGAASADELHALDFLAYAYLQRGQEAEGEAVFERLRGVTRVDRESADAAYALAAVPARLLLERRRWTEAAGLVPAPWFPWSGHPAAEAAIHFARGLAGARSGALDVARAAGDRLAQLRDAAGRGLWSDAVEAQRLTVEAWLAFASGRADEAIGMMRAAAAREDGIADYPALPGPPLPARELLGDMLMEAKRPADALAEYEAVMRASPNRLNAVYGGARAAEEAGDPNKARIYYSSLVMLTTASAQANRSRPELTKARAFLQQEP